MNGSRDDGSRRHWAMGLDPGFTQALVLGRSRRSASGSDELGRERKLFADVPRSILVPCGSSQTRSLHLVT